MAIRETTAPVRVRSGLLLCVLATIIVGFLSVSPDLWALRWSVGPHFLAAHLVLEFFAVMVCVLIVVVAWHSLDRTPRHGTEKALIFGFSAIAGLDLIHTLSNEGMPPFITASSTAKSIFFWQVGRFVELGVLLLVARCPRMPAPRGVWLGLGLGLVACFGYLGIFHLDQLPTNFVPGQGVTPFKVAVEYLLSISNLLAAVWLLRVHLHSRQEQALTLAIACWLMGLGEFVLASYSAPSSFNILLGHCFKVFAYGLIYRATLIHNLREPFELLEASERHLLVRKNELKTLMRNLPIAIARIDKRLRFVYANDFHLHLIGKSREQFIGRHVDEILAPSIRPGARQRLRLAFQGELQNFDYKIEDAQDELQYRHAQLVPEFDDQGKVASVLSIVMDTTEREQAKHKLMDSLREVSELKAALDAHAIVAVTDARGIITQVNDKFCKISKYERHELIGRTHSIINSGYHPKSFFQELWRTIATGQVWHGEICNRARDGSLYWVYTTIVPFIGPSERPTQFVAIRADITTRKNAEQEAQRMAFHDALTGLPNRRLMGDRLRHSMQSAQRGKHYGALLLLDLDNFKEVNDTLGHAFGDELLRQVAIRLRSIVREVDTVARLGGDEFVVILDDLGTTSDIATTRCSQLSEKVREALANPYELAGQNVSAPPSIGVVMFGSPGGEPDELLKQADMALYKAKADGRNCVRFFDPALQAEITLRAALLRDLRYAVDQEELELHYQPVVDAHRHILGVEALLRWPSSARGMVSPAVFIPLAEQSGLVLPLGRWVLRTACKQISEWQRDPLRSAWTVAVNVSARQLHESDFVDEVLNALAAFEAPPGCLRLELTESMLQDDLGATIDKMLRLRERGVRFSLDDFGTGYSSLSYLKRLPLDQLKIDKSFVSDVLSDPSDEAIARTILSLAHNLQLDVVAEGVETDAQFELLVRLGCPAFQGFLFFRPMPIDLLPSAISVCASAR